MSFARGERVYFDLDSDIGDIVHPERDTAPPSVSSAFVGDILERNTGAANPPTAPILKPNVNGFPAHKKRTPKTSAFKQRRAAQEQAMQANQPPKAPRRSATADEEKRQIDEENRQKLAGMSTEEIAQEREELFSSLPASLIQKFLGRANLDEGSNERDLGLDLPTPIAKATDDDNKPEITATNAKKVSFATPDTVEMLTRPPPEASEPTPPTLSKAPTVVEPTITTDTEPSDSFHFPNPTQPPDLDPSDPAFLENLHTKYFPNLAYDPSSLSWMAPIDPDDKKSPYHPSQTAYNASDLRFDFKGNLLAPSVARELPVTKGLHHHADAPEAAGYTIPELAVMARSAVPAQRCVAFQTLGRFLYRLGRGEFGFEKVRQRADGPVQIAKNPMAGEEEVDEDDIEVDMEDAGSQMAAGLWACVEEGRVVETLTEEAKRKSGHLSSITFAQEAVWNFQRGGGRKRQAI